MYLWVKNVPGNVSGLEITQVTGSMPKPVVMVEPEKVDASVQRWFEDAMRRVFGKVSW